jgi:hypothetical protein
MKVASFERTEGIPSVHPELLWSAIGCLLPNLDYNRAVAVDVRSIRGVRERLLFKAMETFALRRAVAVLQLIDDSRFSQWVHIGAKGVKVDEEIVNLASTFELRDRYFHMPSFKEALVRRDPPK